MKKNENVENDYNYNAYNVFKLLSFSNWAISYQSDFTVLKKKAVVLEMLALPDFCEKF